VENPFKANYLKLIKNYIDIDTSWVFKITWINSLDPYRWVRADGEAKTIFSSQNGHLWKRTYIYNTIFFQKIFIIYKRFQINAVLLKDILKKSW